jgi:predicted Zn-dependent protease
MRIGRKGAGRAALGLALAVSLVLPARAASVIRDAEIEGTIHAIADPIFTAAGLDKDSIKIFILNDDKLNSFVAGGQNLFLNTGLLIRAENVDQLAGVIAHETGHIAGGHLSRMPGAQKQAMTTSLLGAVLGAAAAVAGAPDLGAAIMAGGMTAGQGGLLAFSRTQESAADQAAVRFLDATHRSPQGLLDFFKILQTQNLRITTDGAAFLRTHPLTQDRIDFLEARVGSSPWKDARPDPALAEADARMVAKLDGFLAEPSNVIQRRAGDSLPDRYARAVAYYRMGDLPRAQKLVDGLIGDRPNDPWFHELKGQMLFEGGKVAEAEQPYRTALRLRPDAALLRYGLARSLMEQGGDARLKEAVALLKEAVRVEPDNGGAWHFLGVAQGEAGEEGEASLSLAEAAVLARKKGDAQLYLQRAQQLIKPGEPSWYRAQDLQNAVADLPDERPQPASVRRPF